MNRIQFFYFENESDSFLYKIKSNDISDINVLQYVNNIIMAI